MPSATPDKQRLRLLLEEALADAPRATPRCPHAELCGGCVYQEYAYAAQARAKRYACRRLLEELLPRGTVPDVELVESPRPYAYRQRMDFVFAFRKAGLRRRGKHRDVVDLSACPLLGEPAFSAFRRARILADDAGLASYDYLRFRGELRYFVVRRNRAGEAMLSFVTKTDTPETGAAVERVAAALLAERRIVGAHWLHAPGKGDVSFGTPLAHWGAPLLHEYLNGLRLAIGANSFFQANPWVAARAYAALAEWADGARRAWDLYAGTGVIGLHLAARMAGAAGINAGPDTGGIDPNGGVDQAAAITVTGVESETDNVQLAARNYADFAAGPLAARRRNEHGNGNGNENEGGPGLVWDFRQGDAGRLLRHLARAAGKTSASAAMDSRDVSDASDTSDTSTSSSPSDSSLSPDFVAVNPPRVGLGAAEAKALGESGPQRIAYLSCNPASLARDLGFFGLGERYTLCRTTVFDMFPQTPHFETLALLERKE